MVRIVKKNEWFEACMKDPRHPYRNKRCGKGCPTWDLCMRGELIDTNIILIVDADSPEKLVKLAKELKQRGYKAEIREFD